MKIKKETEDIKFFKNMYNFFYKNLLKNLANWEKKREWQIETILREIAFIEKVLNIDNLIELKEEHKEIKEKIKKRKLKKNSITEKIYSKLTTWRTRFSIFSEWISEKLVELEANSDKINQITTEIALKIIAYNILTKKNEKEK